MSLPPDTKNPLRRRSGEDSQIKLVPTKGLEPSPAYTDCDLNAARLPFRHVGIWLMTPNVQQKRKKSSGKIK